MILNNSQKKNVKNIFDIKQNNENSRKNIENIFRNLLEFAEIKLYDEKNKNLHHTVFVVERSLNHVKLQIKNWSGAHET